MVTAGLVLVLFVVWQLFGTGLATVRAQHELRAELVRGWAAAAPRQPARADRALTGSRPAGQEPTEGGSGAVAGGAGAGGSAAVAPAPEVAPEPEVAPAEGRPVALLAIPRLSDSWVVVQGVSLDDLALGPGHYPGTAMPGGLGNFAVAGHRATHDQPFAYLDQVRLGDDLLVTTASRVYDYRVTASTVVVPTAQEVLDPVPGDPGAVPTQRQITLTTCNPRWGHSSRLVVHGVLARTTARVPGPPAAAAAGPGPATGAAAGAGAGAGAGATAGPTGAG